MEASVVKILSRWRKAGRNPALDTAAYITRTQLTNAETGKKTRDYPGDQKDVIDSGIALPSLYDQESASAQLQWQPLDRAQLWTAVEKADAIQDDGSTAARPGNTNLGPARLAHHIILPLPASLFDAERRVLTFKFAKRLADTYGTAVDIGLHMPDEGEKNFHAHLLMANRRITDTGLGERIHLDYSEEERKQRGIPLSREDEIRLISREWMDFVNEALERSNRKDRIVKQVIEVDEKKLEPIPAEVSPADFIREKSSLAENQSSVKDTAVEPMASTPDVKAPDVSAVDARAATDVDASAGAHTNVNDKAGADNLADDSIDVGATANSTVPSTATLIPAPTYQTETADLFSDTASASSVQSTTETSIAAMAPARESSEATTVVETTPAATAAAPVAQSTPVDSASPHKKSAADTRPAAREGTLRNVEVRSAIDPQDPSRETYYFDRKPAMKRIGDDFYPINQDRAREQAPAPAQTSENTIQAEGVRTWMSAWLSRLTQRLGRRGAPQKKVENAIQVAGAWNTLTSSIQATWQRMASLIQRSDKSVESSVTEPTPAAQPTESRQPASTSTAGSVDRRSEPQSAQSAHTRPGAPAPGVSATAAANTATRHERKADPKRKFVFDAAKDTLPEDIRDGYLHVRDTGFYRTPDDQNIGFEIRGRKVLIPSGNAQDTFTATKALLYINQDRKQVFRVTGSEEFRRRAWLSAASLNIKENRNIKIKGYEPKAGDWQIAVRMAQSDHAVRSDRQEQPEPNKAAKPHQTRTDKQTREAAPQSETADTRPKQPAKSESAEAAIPAAATKSNAATTVSSPPATATAQTAATPTTAPAATSTSTGSTNSSIASQSSSTEAATPSATSATQATPTATSTATSSESKPETAITQPADVQQNSQAGTAAPEKPSAAPTVSANAKASSMPPFRLAPPRKFREHQSDETKLFVLKHLTNATDYRAANAILRMLEKTGQVDTKFHPSGVADWVPVLRWRFESEGIPRDFDFSFLESKRDPASRPENIRTQSAADDSAQSAANAQLHVTAPREFDSVAGPTGGTILNQMPSQQTRDAAKQIWQAARDANAAGATTAVSARSNTKDSDHDMT